MTNDALQIKVKERVNKLDSQDYDNFETWQVLEAFNKAQLQYARAQVAGLNPKGQVDESTKQLIDDLECLLTTAPLTLTSTPIYDEAALPQRYLGFKRVDAQAHTTCCGNRPLQLYSCEQANVTTWLRDEHKQPSFDWAETFYALGGGRVQLYHNGQFTMENASLLFYQEPRVVTIDGVLDLTTGLLATADVSCVFPEAVCELLVDKCVGILAGDTENSTQYQRAAAEVAANL